jgi:Spy/CpxP family protein refolding chaperone
MVASTRLKVWLVVVAVFALGCVTGALLDSAYRLRAAGNHSEARTHRDRDEMFEGMRHDLDLNDQQATGVRQILEQTRGDFRALRAEARPRYDSIRQSARARIRALLTPDQQRRFDEKTAEMDARRDADEK